MHEVEKKEFIYIIENYYNFANSCLAGIVGRVLTQWYVD